MIGSKLKSARKIAGISLRALAEKLGNQITFQALNKYENDIVMPNSDILIKVAEVLNVPLDYFFRKIDMDLTHIEFRKKNSLKKTEMERVKEVTRDFLERYLELEQLMNIQSQFNDPLENNQVKDQKDIEKYSSELRKAWNLGLDPVPDVIDMLEKYEIKIIEVEENEDFNGMSALIDKIPVIVINKNLKNDRKRFTALHELAHLILDFSALTDNKKEEEKLCHQFSNAFLFPRERFVEEFGKKRQRLSVYELIKLKEYYGISIQAIMHRAKILGFISEYTYKDFCIWINQNNYKKNEPGEYCSKESPSRFKRLLYRCAAEEVITMSKAASLANQKLYEFEKEFQAVK